jgi:hypothetical protein
VESRFKQQIEAEFPDALGAMIIGMMREHRMK